MHSSVSDSKLLHHKSDVSEIPATPTGRRRDGRRSQTLPGGPKQPSHLLSAVNIQQRGTTEQQPKQQIPFKLAKLGSLSTGKADHVSKPEVTSPPAVTSPHMHQILPTKLLEDNKSPKANFGYKKLGSGGSHS